MGRSRSPHGGGRSHTEWISRAIAGFGRYPEKRPPGLDVDGTGAFILDDLVRFWGRHQNLSQDDILQAVRKHMYHQDSADGTCELRFAVDADSQQNIIIRVMQKRGVIGGSRDKCATPARSERHQRGRHRRHGGGAGNAAQMQSPFAQPQASSQQTIQDKLAMSLDEFPSDKPQAATQRTTEDKLAMSLDELVHDGRVQETTRAPARGQATKFEAAGYASAVTPNKSSNARARRDRILGQCAQMGLTVDTMHRRQKPGIQGTAAEDGYFGDDCRGRRRGKGYRSEGDKVYRWVSWVMRSGYKQLGITNDDGWVNLHELAFIMGQERPRFGQFDADKLEAHLNETDNTGQFEVANGRMRKVDKERQATGTAFPGKARGRQGSSDSSRSSPRRMPGSPIYIDDDDDDNDLAATCHRALNVSADAAATAEGSVPSGPPGDHWTKYQDDGTSWWYYEGPLGKWWCGASVGITTPQRWTEDE